MFQDKALEINDITNFDSLMIKSAIEIIYNESYQCGKCVKKVSEAVRERSKNCTGKSKVKRQFDEFTFSQCPGNFYNTGYAQLLDTHRLFRKGVLAFPGGLLDQPAKYVSTMNLLESLILEKEIAQIKKQSKKGPNNGK